MDYISMATCYRYYCLSVVFLFLIGCDQDTPDIVEDSEAQSEEITIDLNELIKDFPDKAKLYAHLFEEFENPSRSIAQMWVESRGNPWAKSPYGGIGLMQFTAPTVETAENSYCAHLGKGDPEDPYWSVLCYDAMMTYFTLDFSDDYCFNKEMDELRYNAGMWPVWEMKAAPQITFDSAESICGVIVLPNGRMRSERACQENYMYDDHIDSFQPMFIAMGGIACY